MTTYESVILVLTVISIIIDVIGLIAHIVDTKRK